MKLSTAYTRRPKRKSINGGDMMHVFLDCIFWFHFAHRQSTANLQFRFSCCLFFNGKSDTIAMHVSNCALSQNSTASPLAFSAHAKRIWCIHWLCLCFGHGNTNLFKTSSKESTIVSMTDHAQMQEVFEKMRRYENNDENCSFRQSKWTNMRSQRAPSPNIIYLVSFATIYRSSNWRRFTI